MLRTWTQADPALVPPSAAPTILVVDDDLSLVEAIVAMLGDEGFVAEGFTDPAYALERLRNGPPASLVLSDCVMPRMTGAELVAALEAEGIETPVVLMTALSDPSFCVHPGRAPVLNKPFDMADLLAEIRVQLRPAGPSTAPPPEN